MVQIINEGPKVFVAGYTTPHIGLNQYLEHTGFDYPTSDSLEAPTLLVEIGGRISYESWNRAGTPRADYIDRSITSHGHLSTHEHVVYNLIVVDTVRSALAEITRHRVGISPSWNSQRYTDKRLRFVIPPRYRNDPVAVQRFTDWLTTAVEFYNDLKTVEGLATEDRTLRKKRRTEAARGVLPNMTALDGLMTINARAIRHLATLRTDEHADLSIRELAYGMFKAAQAVTPELFADAYEEEAELVPVVKFRHQGH